MKTQGQKFSLTIKLEFSSRHKDMYSSNSIYEPYIAR